MMVADCGSTEVFVKEEWFTATLFPLSRSPWHAHIHCQLQSSERWFFSMNDTERTLFDVKFNRKLVGCHLIYMVL